jgi:integrase
MKRPTLQVREYKHSATHPYYLDLRGFGLGRKFFRTKAEAEAERLRQSTLRERAGHTALGLSLDDLAEVVQCRKKLASHKKTIGDATAFYLDHLERIQRCKVTVSELTKEILEAKTKDGHSPAYLADLRKRLAKFCETFGNRLVASVTVEELDDWLRNLNYSPKSRANFRANVGVLFSYAEKRRMIDNNPILRTARPKLIDKAPEIFSVNELQALLDTARARRPDVVPMLALGAFAGLRDAEIKRLNWREVHLDRGFVEIKAAKSKTAKRRIIKIQPNLAEWLAPYADMIGQVVPLNARKKLDSVRKASGLTVWSNNGLRHSFASYRLAATNDAATVAAELGHSTSQMLYSTYREVVMPEDAERYWKVTPATEVGKIVAFSRRQNLSR